MKRTYFAPILLVLLLFPAAAQAAGGGVGNRDATAVGEARPVALRTLRQPVARFQRVVHVIAHRIAVEEAAIARRHRRERRERFTQLPGGVSLATLESIASCESGGDPAAVSAGGTYRGKYQFDYGTWESVGGHGDPAAAPEDEQDYRAALLYSRSGSSPWPVCG
jgi:hypothetical protein